MTPSRAYLTLQQRCQPITLLALDVDGVLTEGGIFLGEDPLELKQFHVRDGSGLACWRRAGKRTALITGRSSPAVSRRAAELGIDVTRQGVGEKRAALAQILRDLQVSREAVCYVGDDLPDLPALALVGLVVAVADGCPEVRHQAHYITQRPGGKGAVREVVELILRCQGGWPLPVFQDDH